MSPAAIRQIAHQRRALCLVAQASITEDSNVRFRVPLMSEIVLLQTTLIQDLIPLDEQHERCTRQGQT
jgi:hypothetical protein